MDGTDSGLRLHVEGRVQTAGDSRITLSGFRFLGIDADWHHDMELGRGVDEKKWRVLRCSCGTRHQATMSEMKGLVEFTADVRPGMEVIDGFQTR